MKLAPQWRTFHKRTVDSISRKAVRHAAGKVKLLVRKHALAKSSHSKRGTGHLWHDIASSVHIRTTKARSMTIFVDHFAARMKERGGVIEGGVGQYSNHNCEYIAIGVGRAAKTRVEDWPRPLSTQMVGHRVIKRLAKAQSLFARGAISPGDVMFHPYFSSLARRNARHAEWASGKPAGWASKRAENSLEKIITDTISSRSDLAPQRGAAQVMTGTNFMSGGFGTNVVVGTLVFFRSHKGTGRLSPEVLYLLFKKVFIRPDPWYPSHRGMATVFNRGLKEAIARGL